MSHGAFTLADVDQAPPQTGQFSAADLDSPPKPAGATSRLGTNFLSGLGVTSNEDAKNFFVHPLDAVIKSFEKQGELAKKARDAYNRGDYMGALQHGLNYLVPFVGQQTDQAGEQLKEGDIAGGVGRTLGAAVPIVAGSPEVQSAVSDAASAAASTGARGVRAAARGANVALEKAPGTVGAGVGAAIGGKFGGAIGAEVGGAAGALAGKELLPTLRIPGEGFGLPSRVTGGPASIPPEAAVEAPGEAGSMAESVAAPAAAAPKVKPAVLQQQLEDALGGKPLQKNVPLRNQRPLANVKQQIADAAEKPATQTPRAPLTNLSKQIADEANPLPQGFTPVESSAVRGYKYDSDASEFTAITQNGQKYTHGEVTPEEAQAFADADSKGRAWNTIRNNHVLVKQNGVPVKPVARTVVIDPATGQPEFSDVVAAKTKSAKATTTKAAPTDDEDLTSILQQSLKQIQQKKAAQ